MKILRMKKLIVKVKTEEQLKAALRYEETDAFIIEPSILKTEAALLSEKNIYFSMPYILKENKLEKTEKILRLAMELECGLEINTIDELAMVKELGFKGNLISGSFLYAYNNEALRFYEGICADTKYVLSDELTDEEIKRLDYIGRNNFIYKAYGYQRLMITQQCIRHNYMPCGKDVLKFKDEKGNEFFAAGECEYCYSIIYNKAPTNMLDKMNDIDFDNILIDFSIESKAETERVIESALKAVCGEKILLQGQYTRGHHFKGVD